MTAKREAWRTEVMPGLAPAEPVSVDETWAKTSMTRTHGSAPGSA